MEATADISDHEVVDKYKTAGDIASKTMKTLIDLCVPGARTRDLCEKGDESILSQTKAVFNKKVDGKLIAKGIAFPTCINVNSCVCHNSPLKSDSDEALAEGDVINIDLGAHVDGYIAVCAHTFVVGATLSNPVKGRKADVVLAAYYASQAAARMLRPGARSERITKLISDVATEFDCTPISDMLSFQITQHNMNTDKAIIQNPSEGVKRDHSECVIEENEVYALDVLMSTGQGKARTQDKRTSVYKPTGETYSLRGKHARAVFSEARKKFHNMPFTLRACEDEVRARMGVKECQEHGLLEPYEVLYEREGNYVAQFRMTVLVQSKGNSVAAPVAFDPSVYSSDHSIQSEEINTLLHTQLQAKKKKNKKKNKKKKQDAQASESSAQNTEAGSASNK